jgi:hypothetical protein
MISAFRATVLAAAACYGLAPLQTQASGTADEPLDNTSGVTQNADCQPPHWDASMPFKGGTANGEEITVRLDTAVHTYEITIDKGIDGHSRVAAYTGALTRNPAGCIYFLSGQESTPLRIDPRGVLIGRIPEYGGKRRPIAFIAFRQTSNALADLAGDWVVSGREFSMSASASSKPLPLHDMRVLPDGRLRQCDTESDSGDRSCLRGAGRFTAHGATFRLLDGDAPDTSLVLGKVADTYVPILLKRGAAGHGLRIFMPRKADDDAPP